MRLRWLLILCLWPALLWAQPYSASPLGSLSFDAATYEQYGKPVAGGSGGSDIWIMTWAGDGNVYAAWGDGRGWDQLAPNAFIGVTRFTDDPPTMAGTDVYGDAVVEAKPIGLVANSGSVMHGFYSLSSDARDGSYYMHSADNGTTWTRTGTKVFSEALDGVRVEGIANAGQAYDGTLPAHADDSYYYVYLHNFGDQGADFYLARVPTDAVETKASYEYVSAIDGSNNASWTSTSGSKIAILTDSNGSEGFVGVTWWPHLNRWVLAKGHSTGQLGVFEGERPWGPWKTLYYGEFRDAFLKFTYQTPQKWMTTSGDPKSLWMAFSGWPEYDNVNFIKGTLSGSDTIAPKAPTALQIATNSASQLTYSWTAPTQNADHSSLSDLAGYNVYVCSGAACTPSTLVSSQGLTPTYPHTGLPSGTLHRLLVKARDASGNLSADSAIVEGPTASVQSLAMSATSTNNAWTLGAGADKVVAVATNDGGTTYITTGSTGVLQQYVIANPTGIAAADTLQSVVLRAWATKTVSQAGNLLLTGVLGANTTQASCALTTNTYTECVLTMLIKPGGGAWTLTDVQNLEGRVAISAARTTRVTMLTAEVTSIPDPAPTPPTNVAVEVLSPTSVRLTWQVPTTNSDGTPLTDLDAIRIRWCTGASCDPETEGTNIAPDLTETDETYDHTSLTTDSPYFYQLYAIDSTAKMSVRSTVVFATPSAAVPTYVSGSYGFYTPGVDQMRAMAPPETAYQVRVGGTVRLILQVHNTGAAASPTFPLECNLDGGSYSPLTTTCSSSPCLRNLGGYSHGATLTQQLASPGGGLVWAEGKVATSATWPTLALGHETFGEMSYDVGIAGLTDEVVCCRMASLDTYTGPAACFTTFPGSSRRGG